MMDIDNPQDLFSKPMEEITNLAKGNTLFNQCLRDGMMFRAEAVSRPKHNSIKYDRTPKYNVVIFDVEHEGRILDPKQLTDLCIDLGFEMAPIYYEGMVEEDSIEKYLDHKSILGNVSVEGVVVKRTYNQLYVHPFRSINKEEANHSDLAMFMPARLKLVSTKFRELNDKEWKGESADSVYEKIGKKYNTEARWNKVIQHAKEDGLLENKPKDIGYLIKALVDDILEEHIEDIKDELFNSAIKKLKSGFTRGFPEYYKCVLADQGQENA